MKTTFIRFIAAITIVLGMSACGTEKEDNALLEQNASAINTEMLATVQEVPNIEALAMTYADKTLKVDVKLNCEDLKVAELRQPLVEYALAIYLKANTTTRLADIANALGRLEGNMVVTITDVDNESQSYTISHSRLKNLIRARLMELNFNEVKSNVTEIMEKATEGYKEAVNAAEAEFAVKTGFAQYTIKFNRAVEYRNFNQASLRGRYVNKLKPQYEAWGSFEPMVVELLTSLSIEGYRFVYTTTSDSNTINAAIPWRLLK